MTKEIITARDIKLRQAGPMPNGTKVRWLHRWQIPMLGKIVAYDSATGRYKIKMGKESYAWVLWWMVEKIK